MCERLDTPLATDYRSYLPSWFKSVSSMASSHLNVPLGYVFSRQLRICAMTLNPTDVSFRPSWSLARFLEVNFRPGSSPGAGEIYGFPGARLALRLSGLVTQKYLDMAKDRSESSDDVLLLSLTSGPETKCHVIETPVGPRLVTDLPDGTPLTSIRASTDPSINRAMSDTNLAYKSCDDGSTCPLQNVV